MMRIVTAILAIAVSFTAVATETDFSYKPWVAVHDFTVSPDLAKKDKTGWSIAEEMENKLTQTCKFRMVTRAKIAKVLKEKNIASTGSLSPTDLGKVIQAEYIVTGELRKDGDRVVMVAKLLDVSKDTGELEKSFDTWMYDDPSDKMAESLSYMITLLAEKLTMTPGEFLELGLDRIKAKDYEAAFEAFREMQRVTPFDKIKEIMTDIKRNPPPDSQLDIPATGHDAGKQFDNALMLMLKGENKTAAKIFCGIQRNPQAGELIKLVEIAKALAKDQSERLETILDEASRKYWNAVQNKEQQEKEKDPRVLCNEALSKLYGILNDKTIFLSQTTRRRIEQMAAKLEALKKDVYSGPSADGMWVMPELEIAFVPVKPGILTGQAGTDNSNNPQIRYRAKITKPFWIAKHEVSIQQFTKYMKSVPVNDRNARHLLEKGLNMDSEDCPINEEYNMKPGSGPAWGDPSMPMTSVTWQGAMAFCKWLTAAERAAKRLPEGYVYRLPTEAEWEYCCRAGANDGRYYYGNDMAALGDYGWFSENSGNMLHPAGKKKPNAWGIHDMAGNSWEWCYDWYDENFLSFDSENPIGPKNSTDSTKVVRGGGFTSNAEDMFCSARYNFDYKSGKKSIGFRVVCAPAI